MGAGLVLGVAGFGAMWTAIDVTDLLVGVGILVSVVEGAVAAAVLNSKRHGSSLTIRVEVTFVLLGIGQSLPIGPTERSRRKGRSPRFSVGRNEQQTVACR